MKTGIREQLNGQDIDADIVKTERELEKATSIVAQYNQRIKELKRELDFLQEVRERFFRPITEHRKEARSNRFANLRMAQAAEVALREHGRPIHVNEIADSLEQGGYPHTKSRKQLYTSLMACLSRDDTFIRVRPAVFGLRERDAEKEQALPVEEQGQ